MKELDTCETNEHVIFNNMLRSARNPIECAFGRLKARWRILTKKIDFKLEKVPVIIYSCFVLHNFCEENNMAIDHDVVCNQIEIMKANEREFKNIPDPIYSFDEGEGQVVRNTLIKFIKQQI